MRDGFEQQCCFLAVLNDSTSPGGELFVLLPVQRLHLATNIMFVASTDAPKEGLGSFAWTLAWSTQGCATKEVRNGVLMRQWHAMKNS